MRKSPSLVLKWLVALAILALLAALFLVLRVPWLGLSLRPDYSLEQIVVLSSATALPTTLTAPIALVALRTAGRGEMELVLDDAVEEPDLLAENARIAVFLERQTQLHGLLAAPQVTAVMEDRNGVRVEIELEPGPRPFFSLPLSFWVQAVVAIASFLTGCWIWSLRQQDWGARCFLVSGVGILLAAMSAAVYSSRELALDGDLFKILSAINFSGAALFGAAMIGLFLSYPRQLLAPRTMLAITGLLWGAALVHILERFGVLPYLFPDTYIPPQLILVEMSGIILCTLIQWFATRGDPASRAVLRWLGMSIVVCSSLFIIMFYVPVILQEPLVISQGYSFVFFLLIYIGIALGLRRYRLFDLGTWAFRIMFYLGALLGFLVLDALIISMLQLGADISTGISLLIIGFGYLPLRDWLWRLSIGRKHQLEENRLLEAMDIPFSSDIGEADRKWEQLLRSIFDPLELHRGDAAISSPELLTEGVEMALPATRSVSPLTLKFCQGGKRLFSTADLKFARQLLKLLEQAEKSRDAYEHGRQQERRRIAQDLHDDIGAGLLSTLHSEDIGSVRSSIRKTMVDLRAVVGGLVGTQTKLSVLISTLRFETGSRLEEAGIELDWPLGSLEDSATLVDYRFTKNVSSILREAISNVLVHSRATRVSIATEIDDDCLVLRVADNGVGFGNAKTAGGGNGLNNMRARTAAINGTLGLEDCVPGLALRFRLPLKPVAQA